LPVIEKETVKSNASSNEYITSIEEKSKQLLDEITDTEEKLNKIYDELSDKHFDDVSEEDVKNRYNSYKRASKNIFKSYQKAMLMQNEFSTRFNDIIKFKKKKSLFPGNMLIDIKEREMSHFASGINPYKLLLVCFFGCFFGVIIEMLWCLIKHGTIESRAGLVYGPFNLLYGFGAVCMTVSLYKLRNKSSIFSFAGGFAVGTVVEYFCSWFQETLFGSVSWDYSKQAFNINGRVCLLYSVFWGVLGILWMKALYPWMSKLILKLPNRAGKIFTVAATVFLTVNAVITALAVYRWSQRLAGADASNALWSFIDSRFTNVRMERIFPNMKF